MIQAKARVLDLSDGLSLAAQCQVSSRWVILDAHWKQYRQLQVDGYRLRWIALDAVDCVRILTRY